MNSPARSRRSSTSSCSAILIDNRFSADLRRPVIKIANRLEYLQCMLGKALVFCGAIQRELSNAEEALTKYGYETTKKQKVDEDKQVLKIVIPPAPEENKNSENCSVAYSEEDKEGFIELEQLINDMVRSPLHSIDELFVIRQPSDEGSYLNKRKFMYDFDDIE